MDSRQSRKQETKGILRIKVAGIPRAEKDIDLLARAYLLAAERIAREKNGKAPAKV